MVAHFDLIKFCAMRLSLSCGCSEFADEREEEPTTLESRMQVRERSHIFTAFPCCSFAACPCCLFRCLSLLRVSLPVLAACFRCLSWCVFTACLKRHMQVVLLMANSCTPHRVCCCQACDCRNFSRHERELKRRSTMSTPPFPFCRQEEQM